MQVACWNKKIISVDKDGDKYTKYYSTYSPSSSAEEKWVVSETTESEFNDLKHILMGLDDVHGLGDFLVYDEFVCVADKDGNLANIHLYECDYKEVNVNGKTLLLEDMMLNFHKGKISVFEATQTSDGESNRFVFEFEYENLPDMVLPDVD